MLNLWNSMENLARFYTGKSIIAKITDIVPKIVTMYILKQKMNLLWDRLIPIVKNNIDLQACRLEEKDNKYDREKFLALLIDERKSLELFKQAKENILVQRSLLEVHELLKVAGKLQELQNLTYQSVIHNLNSIYRVRNDLVHNGGIMSSAMENQTRQLQKYLNHFLGILIYHMKRNEEILIPEILYSIDSTYEEFNLNIERINKIMNSTGKQIADKEDKIRKITDKVEKEKQKNELDELYLHYENELKEENIKDIAFPKYLYLI